MGDPLNSGKPFISSSHVAREYSKTQNPKKNTKTGSKSATRGTSVKEASEFTESAKQKPTQKLYKKTRSTHAKSSLQKEKALHEDDRGRSPETGETSPISRFSNIEKAAYFLMSIPKEEAATLIRSFPHEVLQKVSAAMIYLKPISEEEINAIQREFHAGNAEMPRVGGKEVAQQILEHAFDEDTAQRVLQKSGVVGAQEIFAFLDSVHGEELYHVLKGELPATVAMILANIPSRKAAMALSYFPLKTQIEITRTIAAMHEVSVALLQQVASPIRQRLSEIQDGESVAIDGAETLATILRTMPHESRTKVISHLAAEDQALATTIHKEIMVPDLLYDVPSRELRAFLQEIPTTDLALFLSDAPSDMRDLIYANVSKRRKLLIEDELQFQIEVSPKEKKQTVHKILNILQEKEKAGDIHFLTSEEYHS